MTDDGKNFTERRTNRRFYVEGFALNSDDSVCAHIVDISRGGMAFRYVEEAAWSSREEESATISGQSFHLENVPLITVSESELNNGLYAIKRCGIKFGNITPDQQYTIENIILENGIAKTTTILTPK
jgi:c-di-GMP-binding flagellar brake protein YcgR